MEIFSAPWSWSEVTEILASARVSAKTIQLPSSTTDGSGPRGDVYDDAMQVRAVLDSLRDPVVLCGHSYGGAVITEVAAGPHPGVRRLVYLAGAVPDVGESLTSLACAADESTGAAEAAREALRFRPDGMIELDPDSARHCSTTAPRDAPRRPSHSWSLPTLRSAPNHSGRPRGA
jgi:pimeloyl-ACP methyl ester carboxylesterase